MTLVICNTLLQFKKWQFEHPGVKSRGVSPRNVMFIDGMVADRVELADESVQNQPWYWMVRQACDMCVLAGSLLVRQ